LSSRVPRGRGPRFRSHRRVVPILGMPIIVEGLEDHWLLTGAQAGYITSIDLAGLFVDLHYLGAGPQIALAAYLSAPSLGGRLNAFCMLHPRSSRWRRCVLVQDGVGAAYASSSRC